VTETAPEQRPAAQRLSACLIVQDEQERLPEALRSLAFCDEIVVVDGGSRDRTIELARAAGAQVIENPWPGYAAQRNVALDAASGDWVLEIDADERVTPQLQASIQALMADPPEGADIAIFALRNRFLGGLLGPSAKYPFYRSRLFRRGAYRHNEGRAVHEGIGPRERPLILTGDLEHELAGSLQEALSDMWRYARLESAHIPPPSSPGAYLKGMLVRPLAKLAYRTIVDGGWRDGWRGLAKISIDAGSDALVWALVLAGARRGTTGEAPAEPADASAGHFRPRRVGSVKVVAVAAGGDSAREAADLLARLRERGADVALIGEQPVAEAGLAQQAIGRLGPLRLIRALEAERQVRPIDNVVPVGRRAALVMRLLPGSFRPALADLGGEGSLRSSE
jgi:hypothetical protein